MELSQEILTKIGGGVWSRNLNENAFTPEKNRIKQGLPVNKKRLFTEALTSILLLSADVGILPVKIAARAIKYSG